ncbi:hypothetical protein [Nocardia cyriacigeorgica]|uniref:hypothetical protein n=1 Tax=Nocardia cyriacigeorgica TaxID=135487 RepID=UPI00248F4B15|nr:hypothetical protein [Nocardia cyriacigeorgica]BDU05650.1 hypothetical protein FMUBM48_19130 [Nocardia cyriacigeorgica]
MSDVWELRVLTGGNSLLTERLTRELRSHLGLQGVDAAFATSASASAGHKSGISQELVLLVSAGLSAGAARVLTTLIREWCERDRRRQVELRIGDAELVLSGNTADQLDIVDKFLGEVAERRDGEPQTELDS